MNIALYQILAYTIHLLYKNLYKNNKFRKSAPSWYEKLELLDRSYSAVDNQNSFEYITKKRETVTDNPSLKIYVNKIENRFTFKIKAGYYLELLSLETIKFLGST